MTEDEIKEMRAIFSEYFDKTGGYEAQIRETHEHVGKWVNDPDMQVSTLSIAAHSLSCARYHASKATELLDDLTVRIRARRKEERNVA